MQNILAHVFFICKYWWHNTNKGIEQMTKDTKPSAEEIAFWESIKQDMLDRADIVADFDAQESEALSELHHASASMSEDVHYLMHFAYRDVVNFCRYSDILRNDWGWHHSECKEKCEISSLALKLSISLRDEAGDAGRLSFDEAQMFHALSGRISTLKRTKPNKYQMERFAEHGITWEGEVDEH